MCLAMVLVFSASAFAQDCTYCNQDLEGKNPLKCSNCIDLATKITKHNKKVWVLDFKRHTMGRVQIKDDTGDTETYWFLPYTLTNKDEVAHSYFIDVSARSDRGKRKFKYHDLWISDVYEEVRKILGKREGQQLLSQRDVSMPPPGEANVLPKTGDQRTKETAKIALPTLQPGESAECVAIFGPFHPEMDRLVISVRGLTNSSLWAEVVRRPAPTPRNPNRTVDTLAVKSEDRIGEDSVAPKDKPNRRIITEAVLELHYKRPGDEFAHNTDAVVFVRRRWVDVRRTIKSDLKWRPPNEGRR
jgi:hypothetical protein